jgi:hypothetical protein
MLARNNGIGPEQAVMDPGRIWSSTMVNAS